MWWGCQIGKKFTGLIRPYVNWLRDLGGLDHPFPSVAGLPDWATSPDGRTLKVGRILTGLNEELRFIEYLQTIPEKKSMRITIYAKMKQNVKLEKCNPTIWLFQIFLKEKKLCFEFIVKTFQQIYFKLFMKTSYCLMYE